MRSLKLAVVIQISVWLLSFINGTLANIQDKYCGMWNCYELLNVSSKATTEEIRKAYRRQALKYHPDRNRNQDTTELYKEINQAYEVLSDEALRSAYDAFVENPDAGEMYHYYKYYGAVYSPKTNPFYVVGGVLVAFSILQYWARVNMYQNALKYIENTAQFRARLDALYHEAKEANPKASYKKTDFIPEARKHIKLHGGYSEPKILDLLLFKFCLLPVSILQFFYYHLRWLVLFTILKKPYGPKEREVLTQKALNLRPMDWERMEDHQREAAVEKELWIPEKMEAYLKQQAEEQANQEVTLSAAHKRYLRWKKNN